MSAVIYRRVNRVSGYPRFEVYDANADFMGEVFMYYTDIDARTGRWLAQRLDGTIYGWTKPFRTRKAAAEALL